MSFSVSKKTHVYINVRLWPSTEANLAHVKVCVAPSAGQRDELSVNPHGGLNMFLAKANSRVTNKIVLRGGLCPIGRV